jgi:predicted lipid-binding transport protein (Tim44 family)
MRRFLTVLMITLAGASMLATADAEAKRLGGGKSIGMRRDASPDAPKAPATQPQQNASQSAAAAASPTAAAAKPGMSRWLGPLAGFGLGAMLMSMFGGGAMMGALGNILMIALLIGAVFFVIHMLRRKASPPASQPMQYAGEAGRMPAADVPFAGGGVAAKPVVAEANRYPEGFDAEGFVRQAKVSFMRLQAANDAKDIRDIRDYTTPELYAELAMQIQERGDGRQKTDVVTLNAELLNVTVEEDQAIASVRFTGLVREEEASGATPIDETWHVVKNPKDPKATWLIAGIEQNV